MKARFTIIVVAILFITIASQAQNISGNYYGIGNVVKDGNYSQYLSELILAQKGNRVSGEYNYYFKSSYIASKVKGTYDKETRVLTLEIFPLLNFKSASSNGADCPMRGIFILKLSKVETTLTGEFESVDAYKYTCPSIFIRLKKEDENEEKKRLIETVREKSEVPTEPVTDELLAQQQTRPDTDTIVPTPIITETVNNKKEVKPTAAPRTKSETTNKVNTKTAGTSTIKKETKSNAKPVSDSLTIVSKTSRPSNEKSKVTEPASQGQITTPANQPSTTFANQGSSQKTVGKTEDKAIIKYNQPSNNKPAEIKKAPEEKPANATDVVSTTPAKVDKEGKEIVVSRKVSDTLNAALPAPNEETEIKVTNDLLKRSFEESPVIEIESDSLQIAMYDNGEVDGDSVALFHNRKLLLRNQLLSDKPIYLTIGIDTTIHEISMYAENLGTMPPNTAVCIIMAGGKRYELVISSNYIRNGTIRFRKKTEAQLQREQRML